MIERPKDDQRPHVLVVEDEEHLAIGIKYNLEAEGYDVTTVGDGPAALKAIESDPDCIDLVILDLMLPGMSGYAVCESLRESGNEVPILILSARTLVEDRVRGYDLGADQYLNKPFELEELLSMTRNLLQRRGAASPVTQEVPNRFEFDDASIDFDSYEVIVRGEPRRLTNTQMKLLRYFVENEGKVIPRGELLEQVWGVSHQIATRTVDNFIVELRKVFEHDTSDPKHFLSVRGAGYRFVSSSDGTA